MVGKYDNTFSTVGGAVFLGLWEDKTLSDTTMNGHTESSQNMRDFVFGYCRGGKVHLSLESFRLGGSDDDLIADCMLQFKDSLTANANTVEAEDEYDDPAPPPAGGGGGKRQKRDHSNGQGGGSKGTGSRENGKGKGRYGGGKRQQGSGRQGQNNQDLDLDMCDDAESLFYKQLPTIIAQSSASGVKSIRPQLDSLSSGESTLHSNFVQQYLTDVWTSRSEKA